MDALDDLDSLNQTQTLSGIETAITRLKTVSAAASQPNPNPLRD